MSSKLATSCRGSSHSRCSSCLVTTPRRSVQLFRQSYELLSRVLPVRIVLSQRGCVGHRERIELSEGGPSCVMLRLADHAKRDPRIRNILEHRIDDGFPPILRDVRTRFVVQRVHLSLEG